LVHTGSPVTQEIVMSHPMSMLNAIRMKLSFGLTRSGSKPIESLVAPKLIGFRDWLRQTKRNDWKDGMTSLTIELLEVPKIQGITVTDDTLSADLSDGRTISVPVAWYPRLMNASMEERNDWRFIADGEGIHWIQLDEDISIKNLLLGQPSGESQRSLQRWLKTRAEKV
jgi:Protein of unknown function (DUF2442)